MEIKLNCNYEVEKMPNKNKLSIFMIKKEFVEDSDIVDKYSNVLTVEGIGTVYWGDSRINVPQWASSFFAGRINTDRIFTVNARAVLFHEPGWCC